MPLLACLKTHTSCWPFNKASWQHVVLFPPSPFITFGISYWKFFFSFEAINVNLWEAYVSSNKYLFFLMGGSVFSIVLKCVFLCNGVNFSYVGIKCCQGRKMGKSSYWSVMVIIQVTVLCLLLSLHVAGVQLYVHKQENVMMASKLWIIPICV